jgi:hypothetical protein
MCRKSLWRAEGEEHGPQKVLTTSVFPPPFLRSVHFGTGQDKPQAAVLYDIKLIEAIGAEQARVSGLNLDLGVSAKRRGPLFFFFFCTR